MSRDDALPRTREDSSSRPMPAFDDSVARHRAALAKGGLGTHANAIAALCLPCVELTTLATPDLVIPIGSSKVGGAADVEPGFEWPEFEGRPLAFLAQLDLADLGADGTALGLPVDGLLLFFYEVEEGRWGFDPKDRGCSRVVWTPPGTHLERRNAPPDAFFSCRATLALGASLPAYDAAPMNAMPLSEEEGERYYDLYRDQARSPHHQLFGYPDAVQNNDMQEKCAMVTSGIYLGTSEGYKDARAAAARELASAWRLLLQLDSDDEAGMMWGDSGMLYFWIREEDLRERRFDEAWLILQCC